MRILVVEDDAFFQKFYSAKLREAGYEVDVASNGEEGLLKMRGTPRPDLVLLDLIMPIKSGFDVLNAWRIDPEISTIPIFVFSTLSQEEEVAEATRLGAKDYINKGMIDFKDTLAKIAAITPQ